jgi:agmatinase
MTMDASRRAPRYTGVRTFAGLEHHPLLGEPQAADRAAESQGSGRPGFGTPEVILLGVPFDTATSFRPGARFGPEAIRSASSLLRPWHPIHNVDVFGYQQVTDGGDIAITPGNAERSTEQISSALTPLCASGRIPLVLGGDHSISLGELRAHAARNGPLALVILDAHADTWDQYYGERIFHGTILRRAVEEHLVDSERSLIAGIRGSLYAPADLEQARDLGFQLIAIDELRQGAPTAFAERVRKRVADSPVFLGFDIDVIDPSAAPGTGTPEVGGLLAHEALALLRSLAGMRFAGFDVVEVSPPYDSQGQITALLAANVAYEMMALAAVQGP